MKEFIRNSLGAGANRPDVRKPPVEATQSREDDPSLVWAEKSDMLDTHVEEVLRWARSEDGEIPLYLRNELLEALRRLDIVEEPYPEVYPPVPVNAVHTHSSNVKNITGEFHAEKLLDVLRGKDRYEISPEVRKELMDALRSL